MPKRKTTLKDVGEATEALARDTFRVFVHPEIDKRPKEKRMITPADLDDPKFGTPPKTKTPEVPEFWHKAYGAYAPRGQKQTRRKRSGK